MNEDSIYWNRSRYNSDRDFRERVDAIRPYLPTDYADARGVVEWACFMHVWPAEAAFMLRRWAPGEAEAFFNTLAKANAGDRD